MDAKTDESATKNSEYLWNDEFTTSVSERSERSSATTGSMFPLGVVDSAPYFTRHYQTRG